MDSKSFIKLKSKKIVMSMLLFLCSIFFLNMDVEAVSVSMNYNKDRTVSYYIEAGTKVGIYVDNIWLECLKGGNTGYLKSTTYEVTSKSSKMVNKGYASLNVLFTFDDKYFGNFTSCKIHFGDSWRKDNPEGVDDITLKQVSNSGTSGSSGGSSSDSSSCSSAKEEAACITKFGTQCGWEASTSTCKLYMYIDEEDCKNAGYFWTGTICKHGTKLHTDECATGYVKDYSKKYCVLKGSSSSSGSSSSGSSSSGGSTGTTTDDPSIMFDANGGYSKTYNCPTNTVSLGNGICLGSVKSGTTVNFPPNANYKELFKYNVGAFMGWATSTSCMYGKIDKISTSVKVTSDKNLYACYTETFNDDRYLLSGAISGYNCGTKIHITYCKKNADGSEICYYDSIAGQSASGSVDRMKLANKSSACGTTSSSTTTTTPTTTDKGWRWINDNGNNYNCGDQLYITTCTTSECSYTKIKTSGGVEITDDGTVTRDLLDDNADNSKKECNALEVDDAAKECDTPEKKTKQTGTRSYTVCYDKDEDTASDIKVLIKENYKCDTSNGYKLDETSLKPTADPVCNKNNICTVKYTVTCTKGDAAKPTMEVSSGIANSDGKGTINVKASIKEGTIDSYFVSENYLAPTGGEKGWQKTTSNTFTITDFAGTKYIWVQDSEGNISNAVSGTVIDTVNTKNTLGKLELKDANGNIQTPSRTTAYGDNTSKSNKYVRLSSDLSKDSEVLADGFNPFDMEYKLEVSSPTVSVYATLTSTDSKYVEGYEPRTVNLNYGVNTILIKIEDNEGKIRTYTILVTRTDDRTSDNTLNDLTLSVGEINFNSNVTDYKVEIPTSTTSVDVNSTIASDKASYVAGYEPGNVEITGDTTVRLIKVQSQTGSTRTYVITFVKEGTDVISKESLQLSDLVIPGVYMAFEEDVANYSLSVDYETDSIDITPVLKDENSEVLISSKNKNESDYILRSGIGTALEVGENFIEIKVTDSDGEESYYRITIIRKEFGLEISNDTTLKDLKVMGYDIDFDPNDKEYTVKIKQEKTLVITAVPNSNRAEVFIRGNDELTGFSTVRVKVVAENGEYETYSIDIKKDAFNKTIEIASIIAGAVIILVSSGIIIVKKKAKAKKEYFEE